MLESTPLALYLDELVARLVPRRVAEIADTTISDEYVPWREDFLDELRWIAPNREFTGNTAGWMDKRLNGICIEKSHADKMGLVMALARYAIQWTTGARPALSIDWAGRWSLPPLGLYRGVFLG